MICRSPDPLADFHRHEDECEDWESKTPICDICGEHITDEYYYRIGDITFHLECAERYTVDSFVETKAYGY